MYFLTQSTTGCGITCGTENMNLAPPQTIDTGSLLPAIPTINQSQIEFRLV